MGDEVTIPFRGGQAKVVDLATARRLAAWPEALRNKAKDHRFYEIVEETLDSGFEHHYVVLEDDAREVRAVQPIFLVRQNLVEGVPALRAAVEMVRRRFPRFLTMRVLMIGCAAGEGYLGALRPEDESWVADALQQTLKKIARQNKASLVVFKDFSSTYREPLRALSAGGFTRVPSMPMTQLELGQDDFEQYLNTLSKATRKDLRRKFRRVAKAARIDLEVVSDASAVVDEIYPLYLQVHERSALKFERLTKAYFCELGRRMPERVRFFLWRQEGKIIAFSLGLVHAGNFYDDYLGLDYRVALDLHLYFYTFRDILGWAMREGLKSYRSSPLNYEPKLHLGCMLLPLDLYVMHTSRLLNPIFGRAVKLLEPTRHDRVLHRFPNASELR